MKKIKYILTTALIILLEHSFAQLNIGGEPFSFNKEYSYLLKEDIPVIKLQKQNNEQLIIEAEANDFKDRPWQFGVNISTNIDLIKESAFFELPKGKIYRLAVKSETALTINLRFSKYKLPEGAVLYIYNSEKTDIIGGFNSRNNRENEIFATGLINGEKIILDYYEPKDAEFKGELVIDRVTHGFRSIYEYNKSFGSSGECNMNVACDNGTWGNEIRSVCMLVTGGSGFCTGSLINNTNEDGTPYILSANHCYRDPSDMVFRFNWESETCDNPLESPPHDDLSGANLIARAYDSDFMLLEMNDSPPYTYEVYYAGWNANDIPSSGSVGIHHPKGDIKKISYDDDPSESDYYLGSSGIPDSHWKVIWDRETTTENGSSGSPLFDQDHKIIGQLHGGYASCNDLDQPDWYGKFSYSWNTGTTPETRLKDWLDPSNTGITQFPGYDPNIPVADVDAQLLEISIPEQYYYDGVSFIPTIKIRNRGNNDLTSLKINYQTDDNTVQTVNLENTLSSGEITDIIFPEIFVQSGAHRISAFLELPNGTNDQFPQNDTLSKTFYVFKTIFEDDFENARTWYLTGEFEIGEPQGLGGETGYPDPQNAYSGNKVLGVDLNGLGAHPGDYENNIASNEEYAQSPVIDCTNYENTLLSFKRYLGTDSKENDDFMSIEITANDTIYTIWMNSDRSIKDTSWTNQFFDISKIADGKKIIMRFISGPTNHGDQYCGWNIDDIRISGTESKETEAYSENIKLYPNPASDYFYAEFKGIIDGSVYISICDLYGKTVYEKEFNENEILKIKTGDLENLIFIEPDFPKSGMFIITVKTSTSSYSEKIIIP